MDRIAFVRRKPRGEWRVKCGASDDDQRRRTGGAGVWRVLNRRRERARALHDGDEITEAPHRHLNVTAATSHRIFRKYLGRSFKTVLLEMRISHACQRLLATDESVVTIAYASGFNNLSNFNRRFLAHRRCSPRDCRQSARAASASRATAFAEGA